jgi:hypothetical protein
LDLWDASTLLWMRSSSPPAVMNNTSSSSSTDNALLHAWRPTAGSPRHERKGLSSLQLVLSMCESLEHVHRDQLRLRERGEWRVFCDAADCMYPARFRETHPTT